ncbi:MAG: TetR/AcrR family transcriptional regulator [Acidimicrobiales bacterium]
MARVERNNSTTKTHILNSTIELLATCSSNEIRIVDIAKRANVGIPTIYYHYTSREVLISEAQVENFRRLMTNRHPYLSEWREAMANGDRRQFVESFHAYHLEIASNETIEAMWELVRVLADIRTDREARHRFVEIHDAALDERMAIVLDAQRLGWLNPDLDARAYVAHSGTAILGRILLEGSEHFTIEPEAVHRLMWEWIGPRDDGSSD